MASGSIAISEARLPPPQTTAKQRPSTNVYAQRTLRSGTPQCRQKAFRTYGKINFSTENVG